MQPALGSGPRYGPALVGDGAESWSQMLHTSRSVSSDPSGSYGGTGATRGFRFEVSGPFEGYDLPERSRC